MEITLNSYLEMMREVCNNRLYRIYKNNSRQDLMAGKFDIEQGHLAVIKCDAKPDRINPKTKELIDSVLDTVICKLKSFDVPEMEKSENQMKYIVSFLDVPLSQIRDFFYSKIVDQDHPNLGRLKITEEIFSDSIVNLALGNIIATRKIKKGGN